MPPSPNPAAPVPELPTRDLHQRLDRGESLTLLDVREPRERAFCSITVTPPAGDLHIPMRDVPSRLEEIQGALARGPLVVYCHHGIRSMAVAEWLAQRGLIGILNLNGGIDAWSGEADPRVPRY
jgi:rhodanese-related sulfurtransferase